MTDHQKEVFDGLGALAFIVNESRFRGSHISLDYTSEHWPLPEQSKIVGELWNEYLNDVYPGCDPEVPITEICVRNRFFLEKQADQLLKGPIRTVNLAAGLTSYPYSLCKMGLWQRDICRAIEIDLGPMVEFKSTRRRELTMTGALPELQIEDVAQDLADARRLSNVIDLDPSFKGTTIFLLEGISYYLSSSAWNELMSVIIELAPAKSVFLFDFWSSEDQKNQIFTRFSSFMRDDIHLETQSINFLNASWIDGIARFGKLEVTNVFDQELLFLDGVLPENSNLMIPERYAFLQLS